MLTATQSLRDELESRGIQNTQLWSRGIDHRVFNPDQPRHPSINGLAKPVMLSVGRVAIEKNLEAFLDADVAGTKVIVGDGPARAALQARYPDAVFLGTRHGDELASIYASADIFVFPSKTDTFGLVMLEAMACGLPVAGFPVQGPLDVIGQDGRGTDGKLERPVGSLKPDVAQAISEALTLNRADAAAYGAQFCWDGCADQFEAGVVRARDQRVLVAQ